MAEGGMYSGSSKGSRKSKLGGRIQGIFFREPKDPKGGSQAGNGARTRDPELGKLVLYQLSYSRRQWIYLPASWLTVKVEPRKM